MGVGSGAGLPSDWPATAAQIAVRRTGTPADIANAVAFFAAEASGFVTGQVLYVSGTRTAESARSA